MEPRTLATLAIKTLHNTVCVNRIHTHSCTHIHKHTHILTLTHTHTCIAPEIILHEDWCVKESGTAFLGKTNWKKRWFKLVQRGTTVALEYRK